ncbi:type VI secretion system tip protein VgrG [Belnapia sp. T6]|uniref:Type VI secretion system tip protein VgrG n=1 Tax=Belnapia mucosa TaxID=2804532 RepID=A0ABS1VAH6_9PROT|nr:type VI secretion system tip protein TssI/VgrG [Belnapia mucosa]MBL6458669.1 type VI secretion system tip protein VgrG [Belnapia mucosa]
MWKEEGSIVAKQREARLHLEAPSPMTLLRLTGREEVSRVFSYDLTLLSPNFDIDLERLLGSGVTVEIEVEGGVRPIHGIVADAAFRGEVSDQARYDLVLVPWLWFLGRRTDCRIFQHLSAIEIVKRVVAAHGGPLRERLSGHYAERDYCVQYRESDLNFVCRLLEEEGVFFFFEHSAGRHEMVLVDDPSRCPERPGYGTVPFFPPGDPARRERDHLDRWEILARARTARTAMRSFDFKQPSRPLEAGGHEASCHPRDDQEAYDYPGRFVSAGTGDTRARVRLEELRADRRRVRATGDAVGLACGHRFALANFPRAEQNTEHLVLAMDTVVEVEPPRTEAGPASEPYRCAIEAMSTRQPFRPARLTPRPVVQGPQTAIVTGPAGEEIYTDEHGRVKVQFHWDRLGRSDANSSCWLRVSQAWAGAGWGAIQIPRIGQEVIVDFLEGDPDQPIITGRVYNAHQRPPHGLPAAAVKSGIRSNSTKGGGGSSELTFDDTKGKEQVYLHAQHDMKSVVEHDETHTVATGTYTHTVVEKSAERNSKGQNLVRSTKANVQVEAETYIQLHVGLSTLTMDKDGLVQISAKNIILDAQTISFSGKTSVETVGGLVNSTAQGTNTIKGALVKIN